MELARAVPGFGGFFYDESANLVAYLTDLEREPALRDRLQPILDRDVARGAVAAGGAVVVREGDWDFLELREWRDGLEDPVMSTPGVVFLHIDEIRNRLSIGILDEGLRPGLEETLMDLAVPVDAVVMELTGPVVMDSGHTLRDHIRPLVGGLQNRWVDNSGFQQVPCTISFNAQWDDNRVWLTNSHCTEEERSLVTSTNYYQPELGAGNFIGTEAHDPLGAWCGASPTTYCRYSDAAVLFLAGSTDRDFGAIARTKFRGFGWGDSGSIEIDPDENSFRIVTDDKVASGGLTLNKVGRTTGWTAGSVKRTCVHFNKDPLPSGEVFRLLCQHTADYHRGPGDSGSPVFRWTFGEDDVDLYGIHWGIVLPITEEEAIFSPISGVKDDLGPMDITVPPTPTFSVQISGPSEVQPNQTCTWWASVTGGQSPFSYQWSGVLSGTSSQISGSLSSSGTLRLDVTSADQQTEWDELFITVSSSAPSCGI